MYWHILPIGDGFHEPTRGDPEAAGWDLYAPEDGEIDPLSRKLIPLGFKAEFSNGFRCEFRDRSGMANKGIHHFGGLIDNSYRGEWGVILWNSTGEVFRYRRGDRLIQAVFSENVSRRVDMITVTSISDTIRGEGGFGSTGK